MLILEHKSPLSNGVKPNGVKPGQLSGCYNCNYNYNNNNNNIKVITIDFFLYYFNPSISSIKSNILLNLYLHSKLKLFMKTGIITDIKGV